jgi:threonyl-tRNA synthetase
MELHFQNKRFNRILALRKGKASRSPKIRKELELFAFSQKVGQGLPLWLPKALIEERLEQFLKKHKESRLQVIHLTLVRKNYMLPLAIMQIWSR